MTFTDILMSDDVEKSINENLDYLLSIIPELKPMMGFEQKHPHHHLDVWNHTLLALSLSDKDFDIRLSLLLHDIGKPLSYQEGEVRHYKGHPKMSSKIARKILKRLNYDENYIEYICFLIKEHDSPINDKLIESDYDLCLKLYEIQRCDVLAHNPDKIEKSKIYLNKIDKKLKLIKK
jgi:tRNA nucleotidyltransferase (CCA-adding enzyme)